MPVQFGKGISLTLLEAEICHWISANEGLSATELAKVLGITRSAVSQTIVRLVKQGYVRQLTTKENLKLKRLHLTAKGKLAAKGAAGYRQQLMEEVFNVSGRELKSYYRFVSQLEQFQNKVRSGA